MLRTLGQEAGGRIMASANQIGRRTGPTGEQQAAERRVIKKRSATQFAQALQAAFHRRLRKCSLSVLPYELVRRRLLRKNGDAWELTPKGKKELAETQDEGDRPVHLIAEGDAGGTRLNSKEITRTQR